MELAPELVDVFLLVGHGDELHEVVADGRMCAIRTDHEVEGDFDLGAALLGGFRGGVSVEPGELLAEVDGEELVVEEEFYIGHGFEVVEQGLVEACAVQSEEALSPWVIHLGHALVLAIFLKMDHAAMHRECLAQDRIGEIGEAGLVEGIDTSL